MFTSKKYHQQHDYLQKSFSFRTGYQYLSEGIKVTISYHHFHLKCHSHKGMYVSTFTCQSDILYWVYHIDWVFHTEYIYWSYHTEFLLYWLCYTGYFILTTGLLAILVSQTLTFPSRPPLTYCRIGSSSSWCWRYENSPAPTPTPTPTSTPIPAYQLRRTNTPPPSPINTVHHLNSFNNS